MRGLSRRGGWRTAEGNGQRDGVPAAEENGHHDDLDNGPGRATTTRRRWLFGAGAAGLAAAAVAAEQIARPAAAQAGTDGDVVLGQTNTEGSTTVIQNTALAGDAFSAQAQGGVGVSASSVTHWGVSATSQKDTAVQAQSSGGVGVVGVGTATGVYGQSGSTSGFALTTDGVRGYTNSATGSGVRGENGFIGYGVSGTTNSKDHAAVDGTNPNFLGTGVHGVGGEAGVHGESNTWGVRGVGTRANAGSVGVLAQAGATGALALQVQGPAVFSRSGVLTVAAGKPSATVTGVTLTAASLVLVTLQQHVTGVYVLAAVPNVSASSFTVYLSKAVTAATKVAWFVVN